MAPLEPFLHLKSLNNSWAINILSKIDLPGAKAPLILGYAFGNNRFKPINNNLSDDFISYIADANRPKMSYSFRIINLGNKSNIGVINFS